MAAGFWASVFTEGEGCYAMYSGGSAAKGRGGGEGVLPHSHPELATGSCPTVHFSFCSLIPQPCCSIFPQENVF